MHDGLDIGYGEKPYLRSGRHNAPPWNVPTPGVRTALRSTSVVTTKFGSLHSASTGLPFRLCARSVALKLHSSMVLHTFSNRGLTPPHLASSSQWLAAEHQTSLRPGFC
jgi:hypothetical protein